jgi:hypothetical protein
MEEEFDIGTPPKKKNEEKTREKDNEAIHN